MVQDSSQLVIPFMRAGTYPARGYATLERSELPLTFTGAYTAASKVWFLATFFNHNTWLTSTGQASASIHGVTALQRPMFLLNSRLRNFCCNPISRAEHIQMLRSAFFFFFLNHHYSNTLVYSTSSPVSVYGTDKLETPKLNFSWKRDLIHSSLLAK